MSRQGIARAHKRMITPSYKHLTPQEKRLVKMNERMDSITRSIDRIFTNGFKQYGEDFRTEAQFQDAFTLAGTLVTEREKLWASRDRLCKKYQLNEAEILDKFRQFNTHSTSY